jgi:hypothetical protein
MKKLSILFTCTLAVCLLIAGVAPVQASEGNQDPPLLVEDIDSGELEALDKLDLVPVDAPGQKVSITGGFKGVWGTEDSAADERPGKVAGIYGVVEYEDGIAYGFFGGIWKNASGRMAGYLKGRYEGGQFRGIWRCLETGMWGPVVGRYTPAPDATIDAIHYLFKGKWETRDGQLSGYLKGIWSPLTMVKPEGKFDGQWMCDNQLTAACVQPDGKLAGKYGVAVFKDGTRIHYFGGILHSRESNKGRLGGLIVDGRFCGLWNSDSSYPRGYLKGIWRDNRFKGVWGQFGQNSEGRLWGVYRPFVTLTAVEKKPLPAQQAVLTPAAR